MTQVTRRRSAVRLRPGRVPGALLLACLAAAAAVPASAQEAPPATGLTLREVVDATLERNADVALGGWDVQSQAGSLRQAAGAFDPQSWAVVTSERRRTPTWGTASESSLAQNLEYGAGVDWRLRSGLVVSPSLSLSRVDLSTQEGLPRNTGVASLDLVVPFLRGRGGGMLSATERAAAAQWEASRADLEHLRAATVLESATAYWGYVAAVRNLQVLREAEERTRRLVRQTETLIEADERPAVDRIPVAANLASRRAARLAGEQGVVAARRTLALAMGLPAERLATLPPPADSFPAAPDSATAARLPGDSALVEQALLRRADLAAARRRRGAAGELLRGTRADARTRLDLNVGVGYTGLESGQSFDRLFSPFYSERRGFHAHAELSYGLPLGNRAAAGQLLRSTAADRSAAVALAEMERAVAVDVATATETLSGAVEELQVSEEAVRLHDAAVESEGLKFRLGTSTLFDVIQAEDGLTAATLAWIGAQRRYAVAQAQLRFLTGALLQDGGAPGAP